MSYLLSMADKQTANGEAGLLSARSDNLSQALGNRTASSANLTAGVGSYATGTSSHNGNGLSERDGVDGAGGGGYSYDPTQSSPGLGKMTLPNYVEMQAQQKFDEQQEIVLNAIYSFTGVQGMYLKKDVVTGRFKLDPNSSESLTAGQAGMLLRLSELGYYYDRVTKFADVSTGFNAMGCMGQALMSKLKEELSEFHGQVSELHDEMNLYRKAQMNWNVGCGGEPSDKHELTLFKLLAWYIKPLYRLQWLTKIADGGWHGYSRALLRALQKAVANKARSPGASLADELPALDGRQADCEWRSRAALRSIR